MNDRVISIIAAVQALEEAIGEEPAVHKKRKKNPKRKKRKTNKRRAKKTTR